MNHKSQRLVIYAELLTVSFLVIRGLTWLIDHTASHHILDNLSEVAILILLVLFVLAKPTSKKEVVMQKSMATLLTMFGIAGILLSAVGLLVTLLSWTGALAL